MVRDEYAMIGIVAIVLMAIVPLSLYYLGTLGGVDFSGMADNAVYFGGLLLVLFIAVTFLSAYLRRR